MPKAALLAVKPDVAHFRWPRKPLPRTMAPELRRVRGEMSLRTGPPYGLRP